MDWKDLFEYDPTSPTFLINKVTRSPKAIEGKPAGCVGVKEIKTSLNGKFYRNARIIWEMHNGPIPDGMLLKFKDNNEFNLLLDNITLQTRRAKGVNSKMPMGKSGIRGVTEVDGKWQAHAKVNGESVYLGIYATEKEAIVGRRRTLRLMKV